jgi:arylformamidase
MNWGEMSRAERDAAYNNPAAVPESADLLAAWRAASGEFRNAHPEHLDLRYGPRERNTWDLFPAKDPRAPCLVFIHGGYWQRNSKDMFTNLIGGPYVHGWAAALPGYTLAPDATLTDIVAEIRAALNWLVEHGPAHGVAGPTCCPVGPRGDT